MSGCRLRPLRRLIVGEGSAAGHLTSLSFTWEHRLPDVVGRLRCNTAIVDSSLKSLVALYSIRTAPSVSTVKRAFPIVNTESGFGRGSNLSIHVFACPATESVGKSKSATKTSRDAMLGRLATRGTVLRKFRHSSIWMIAGERTWCHSCHHHTLSPQTNLYTHTR